MFLSLIQISNTIKQELYNVNYRTLPSFIAKLYFSLEECYILFVVGFFKFLFLFITTLLSYSSHD